MTSEEMERAIEFLLKNQASFDARLEKTNEQIDRLSQMHAEFAQFVRGFMEAQSEINESLRETVRALTISQARTDERLDNLERGSS
ncbi:MAG: hypothetical protein JOZ52_06165 [Acidobacteria bacterium]|nr:hypothetical protein [Acidobacteriota bacterium]